MNKYETTEDILIGLLGYFYNSDTYGITWGVQEDYPLRKLDPALEQAIQNTPLLIEAVGKY